MTIEINDALCWSTEDFSYTKKTYPNGNVYLEMKIGTTIIGCADITEDGYVAFGRRKPVKTLKEAAKQCLDSKMNDCVKEHTKWHRLLQRLLRHA